MLSSLDKFLDLSRELRLGTTWLVLAMLAVGTDAYTIARFDRSLLIALAQADALVAGRPDLGTLLTEGLYALTTLVLTWFYVLPASAYVWRRLIAWCRSYFPESWRVERPYPRASAGWESIVLARVRAIEENNAVLFGACERRFAKARARRLVLRCVLAIIILSMLGLFESTSTTGPSLIVALSHWMEKLPKGYALSLFVLSVPACSFAWSVLVDHGAEFDNHIQLSTLQADHRREG